jgi:hypothetical protein
MGGDAYWTVENDVWYSWDGVKWTRVTAEASWSYRFYATSVAHNGTIWVIGGYLTDWKLYNDVWYSVAGTAVGNWWRY